MCSFSMLRRYVPHSQHCILQRAVKQRAAAAEGTMAEGMTLEGMGSRSRIRSSRRSGRVSARAAVGDAAGRQRQHARPAGPGLRHSGAPSPDLLSPPIGSQIERELDIGRATAALPVKALSSSLCRRARGASPKASQAALSHPRAPRRCRGRRRRRRRRRYSRR